MKVFLCVLLIAYLINMLMSLYRLAINDYPRTEIKYPGDDVLVLVISLIFGGWAGYLFFIL